MFTFGGSQIGGSVSNTVTVAVSPAPGTNPVLLSVNSGTPSTSVSVTSGTDLLQLIYTGLAINPVTISASAAGATTSNATFSPTTTGVVYSGPRNSSLQPEVDLYAPSGTGSTFNFTAGQTGWTGSFGNSLVVTGASTCSSFASIATPAPAATNFTVTAVASPTNGSCTLGVAGFNSSVSVTITYTTFGVIFH